MLNTTKISLVNHLKDDLKLQTNDLVFLFSSILGLGKLDDGLETIEKAFQEVIPQGTLIVPTFSYSWGKGESFCNDTPCPEMGSFSNFTLNQKITFERITQIFQFASEKMILITN